MWMMMLLIGDSCGGNSHRLVIGDNIMMSRLAGEMDLIRLLRVSSGVSRPTPAPGSGSLLLCCFLVEIRQLLMVYLLETLDILITDGIVVPWRGSPNRRTDID